MNRTQEVLNERSGTVCGRQADRGVTTWWCNDPRCNFEKNAFFSSFGITLASYVSAENAWRHKEVFVTSTFK